MMDEMNLHANSSRRLLSNTEHMMQLSQDSWVAHPHTLPMPPWHTQPLHLGSFYFAHGQTPQRTSPASAPIQPPVQNGGLPHPDRGVRVLQNAESVAGNPVAPTSWALNSHLVSDSGSAASSGMNMASVSSTSVNGPAHANLSIRGPSLQPPSAVGWGSRGVTSDSLSVAARVFPVPGHLGNVSAQFSDSPSDAMFSYPSSPVPSAHSTQIPSSSSQRPQRSQTFSTPYDYREANSILSSTSDRRRPTLARTRRSTIHRQPRSDISRTQDDADQNSLGESQTPAPRSHRRANLTDDMAARQMQMFRSTTSSKLVASRAAIQSLENVEICSLAENEKTCVICYNDYGVASPEGVIEVPVRLPHCKHLFGDYCIKKWLEDSDSCPYCRSKLQSEPKHLHSSARTFLNMMRLRGLPLPVGLSDEVMTRLATRPTTDAEFQELFLRAARTAERRPPPDDTITQEQRRIRQRRSGPVSDEPFPTENRDAQSRPAPGALLRQPSTSSGDFVPGQGSWTAQSTEVAPSSLTQGRQPGLAPEEVSMRQLNPTDAGHEQVVSATRLATQSGDPAPPVVVNGSSLRERSTVNPLLPRVHRHSVPSASAATSTSNYQSSIMSTFETTQRPTDTELSALRPSRIRPW